MALSLDTASRNLILERSLAALQIRCDCGTVFALGQRGAHEADCLYRVVRCLCGSDLRLRELPDHLEGGCSVREQLQRLQALEAENWRLQAEVDAARVREQLQGLSVSASGMSPCRTPPSHPGRSLRTGVLHFGSHSGRPGVVGGGNRSTDGS